MLGSNNGTLASLAGRREVTDDGGNGGKEAACGVTRDSLGTVAGESNDNDSFSDNECLEEEGDPWGDCARGRLIE